MSLRIALIDGSTGYRKVVAALLRNRWPDAEIEDVDPFSQTMRGMGFAFGTKSNLILMGGIGTRSEALSSLQRLQARVNCPPIILMVSHELQADVPLLREAGAAAVLFKDALSRATLIEAIERAVITPNAAETPPVYGQFPFRIDTERYVLGIERYEHLVTLSSNSMAQVFYVERIQDRRPAVVKIATATPHRDADLVQRFCDRYAFFSCLAGNGVVRYLDAGIAGPWPYVVLEYLSKGDLRRRMDKPVEPGEAARMLLKLANALSRVHDGGFAHLDIKPENIFFREGGDLALIDFNISMHFGQVPKNSATGEVLGSPDYMSPEQGQGLPVDGRSDLYSVGVIFYEMLTGAKPYTAKNTAEVIFKHIHEEVPLLPKPVRHLQPIIDGLMAKDRNERFANGAALAAALQPFLSGAAN